MKYGENTMHLKRLLNRRLRVISPLIFLSQNSRAIVERPNILSRSRRFRRRFNVPLVINSARRYFLPVYKEIAIFFFLFYQSNFSKKRNFDPKARRNTYTFNGAVEYKETARPNYGKVPLRVDRMRYVLTLIRRYEPARDHGTRLKRHGDSRETTIFLRYRGREREKISIRSISIVKSRKKKRARGRRSRAVGNPCLSLFVSLSRNSLKKKLV